VPAARLLHTQTTFKFATNSARCDAAKEYYLKNVSVTGTAMIKIETIERNFELIGCATVNLNMILERALEKSLSDADATEGHASDQVAWPGHAGSKCWIAIILFNGNPVTPGDTKLKSEGPLLISVN
jgi:hypothetical protein